MAIIGPVERLESAERMQAMAMPEKIQRGDMRCLRPMTHKTAAITKGAAVVANQFQTAITEIRARAALPPDAGQTPGSF